MPYLHLPGSPPTQAEQQLLNAIRFLQYLDFRYALRSVANFHTAPHQTLKKIHEQLMQEVDMETLCGKPGGRLYSSYHRARFDLAPEFAGMRFFARHHFPVSGFPPKPQYRGGSQGFLGFDFRIRPNLASPLPEGTKGVVMPGYFRVYVGKDFARMEAVCYMGVMPEVLLPQLIEVDWHAPTRTFFERYWVISPADSELKAGAFPFRLTTRWGPLMEERGEDENEVVVRLRKPAPARQPLFEQSDLYLQRSVDNVALYQGDSLADGADGAVKIDGFVVQEDVARFIKEELLEPYTVRLYDHAEIKRRFDRATLNASWGNPNPNIALEHLLWVEKTLNEQDAQALGEDCADKKD